MPMIPELIAAKEALRTRKDELADLWARARELYTEAEALEHEYLASLEPFVAAEKAARQMQAKTLTGWVRTKAKFQGGPHDSVTRYRLLQCGPCNPTSGSVAWMRKMVVYPPTTRAGDWDDRCHQGKRIWTLDIHLPDVGKRYQWESLSLDCRIEDAMAVADLKLIEHGFILTADYNEGQGPVKLT